MQKIVLASSSIHRKKLLDRLKIPFEISIPDVDENPLVGELPEEMVLRLGREKAVAVRGKFPDALIIGSDLVGILDEKVLGKPTSVDDAVAQLQLVSGS